MNPHKLLYVDAMRGWAILLVIASHQALYFPQLAAPLRLLGSYGQTGVFLFFVASAFTLCNSTLQRADESNAMRNFFIRRYFRIAPLYYTGMAFYLALQLLAPELAALFLREQPATNVLANLALVHGFMPTAFAGIVPGGWSIGTEWAFYLMFPLLFAACSRLHERFGWPLLLIPTLGVAAVSALNLSRQDMSTSLYWFWYDSILNQLPVFMLGVMLFFAVRAGRFEPDLRRDIPLFLLLSAGGLWLLARSLFIALPLISGLAFVFLFNILRVTRRRFGWIERFGRVSFSMYVFHFAIVAATARIVPSLLPMEGAWQNLAFALALIMAALATYLLARVTERHIEQRFIAYGRMLTKSGTPSLARA